MESTIEWVSIFVGTIFTEFEICHTGVRAIIGQFANQGVTGSALGTVDKWITVASIGGIQ